jgi:transformation/transcription domain-associated protein
MNLSIKVSLLFLPAFVFFLTNISLKVFADDNEDNALTSLRIIFDLHKSFRPSLETHVQVALYSYLLFAFAHLWQPFLDLVQRLFKNIPNSTRVIFQDHQLLTISSLNQVGREDRFHYRETPSTLSHESDESSPAPPTPLTGAGSLYSHHFGQMMNESLPMKVEESHFDNSQSSVEHDRSQSGRLSTSSEMSFPFLKSLESFKVLTECPLIIMLLFQVYPKFIPRNIPLLLPLMMTVLGLPLSPKAAQVHKVRFREFLASQVVSMTITPLPNHTHYIIYR